MCRVSVPRVSGRPHEQSKSLRFAGLFASLALAFIPAWRPLWLRISLPCVRGRLTWVTMGNRYRSMFTEHFVMRGKRPVPAFGRARGAEGALPLALHAPDGGI